MPIPDPTFETAHNELKEVMNDPMWQYALYFAYKNPELVYGKDSEEFKRAQGGYFSEASFRFDDPKLNLYKANFSE